MAPIGPAPTTQRPQYEDGAARLDLTEAEPTGGMSRRLLRSPVRFGPGAGLPTLPVSARSGTTQAREKGCLFGFGASRPCGLWPGQGEHRKSTTRCRAMPGARCTVARATGQRSCSSRVTGAPLRMGKAPFQPEPREKRVDPSVFFKAALASWTAL